MHKSQQNNEVTNDYNTLYKTNNDAYIQYRQTNQKWRILTRLRSLMSVSPSSHTVLSIVGTAPAFKRLTSFAPGITPGIRVKNSGLKWSEHNTEDDEGANPGRCLLTNFVQVFLVFTSFGNLWNEIFWFWLVARFLQLTPFGNPATQYFPPFRIGSPCFSWLSAISSMQGYQATRVHPMTSRTESCAIKLSPILELN